MTPLGSIPGRNIDSELIQELSIINRNNLNITQPSRLFSYNHFKLCVYNDKNYSLKNVVTDLKKAYDNASPSQRAKFRDISVNLLSQQSVSTLEDAKLSIKSDYSGGNSRMLSTLAILLGFFTLIGSIANNPFLTLLCVIVALMFYFLLNTLISWNNRDFSGARRLNSYIDEAIQKKQLANLKK
ncbi:hypothetical protein [Levilactobacillus brevis]|uniref:hypothetical protein n=1 Tax=Levilactobacillus brevis TaxID=1580 RepID=UPI0031DFAC0C